MYLGKAADGRLIMNMIDDQGKQHWPYHMLRTMEAGTWHKMTVTWDIGDAGEMAIYLDGVKVTELIRTGWRMGRLHNSNKACRFVIPDGAEIAIDELKIWNRP